MRLQKEVSFFGAENLVRGWILVRTNTKFVFCVCMYSELCLPPLLCFSSFWYVVYSYGTPAPNYWRITGTRVYDHTYCNSRKQYFRCSTSACQIISPDISPISRSTEQPDVASLAVLASFTRYRAKLTKVLRRGWRQRIKMKEGAIRTTCSTGSTRTLVLEFTLAMASSATPRLVTAGDNPARMPTSSPMLGRRHDMTSSVSMKRFGGHVCTPVVDGSRADCTPVLEN